MAIRYPNATRSACIAPVNDLLNAGTGPARIRVYTGSQPASADSPATGTLLVTLTLNDPAFTGPANGVLTLSVDPSIAAQAAATGTAGWFRATDSSGAGVFDGSVGVTGDTTKDLTLNTTAINAGGMVSLTSGSLTQSAG